jgi:hypothetical protein
MSDDRGCPVYVQCAGQCPYCKALNGVLKPPKAVATLKPNHLDNTITVCCPGEPFDGYVLHACTPDMYLKVRGGWDDKQEQIDWTNLRAILTRDLGALLLGLGYAVVVEELT